jgi:hypothetical protein
VSNVAVLNAILESNRSIQSSIQTAQVATVRSQLQADPTNTALWGNLPLLSSPTGCLCVYDSASTFLRCGACCLWTVPAGATQAQFQIWGPGAGTGSGCCCGGAPFGATGSYATVIIPVTAGWQYTLCAGCAVCCYAARAAHQGFFACPSFVTGCQLCNFCARGGFAGVYRTQVIRNGAGTICRYQATGCTQSGPCICNTGTDFCFSNSCATCGCIPWTPDPEATYFGCTTTGAPVLGLPSVHSSGCLDTANSGYHQHPPLIGPCHTAQSGSCCCFTFTSGTCGGCCCAAQLGVLCYPGAGGFATHVMGGCNTKCGDSGRGGMVRVTWK